MPKLNPYLIKENYKKVEEVREINNEVPSFEEFMKTYESDEGVIDDYELEVDSYGDIRIMRGYGPGFDDPKWVKDMWLEHHKKREKRESEKKEKKREGLCLADGCWLSSKWKCGDNEFCNKHREEYENDVRFTKWIGKTVITAVAGWYLGPVAFKVGGLVWGTTKIVENVVEDEDMKEVLRFVGDIGYDTAKGAFIGKLIGVGAESFASKTTQEIGHRAATEISSNGGKIPGDVRNIIRLGKSISLGQNTYNLYDKYGKPTCELARHEYHKSEGRSYDSNCEVCRS